MLRIEPGRLYVRVLEADGIHTYADEAPEGTDPDAICAAFVALTPSWMLEVEGRDLREMVLARVDRIEELLR